MQQLTQHIIVVVLICLIAYTVLFYEKHKKYFKIKIPKENFSEVITSDYDENDPPHRSTYSSDEYAHSKLYEEEVSTSHYVGEGGEEY